ncbi:MAG: 50S ribosomal protein L16 [Thermoplasmatales archaeon SG8-52-3]|nr:MAG: 50S ribosomal protein L16 [Thermoplasmatales archaeon SG8-52-3]
MARKPGSMYHNIKQQPYTRREYMGGVPLSRITQFVLGNKRDKFPIQLMLYSDEACQIRHTSLESARIAANRFLEKKIGVNDYRLTISVYPHHVLRENKQATGAGADRVSQGMRASFGKTVGTAARVKRGQTIMKVETFERNIEYSRNALIKASSKLPPPCKIKYAS